MRKKLRAFLIIAALIFATGMVLTAFSIRNANQELNRMTSLHQMDYMRRGVLNSFSGIHQVIHDAENGTERNLDSIIASITEMEGSLEGCNSCHETDHIATETNALDEDIHQFQETLSFFMTTSANRERMSHLGIEAMDRGGVVLRKVENLHKMINDRMHKSATDVVNDLQRTTYVFYATIVAMTVLCVILAFSLFNSILDPINNLITGTKMIEDGNWGMKIANLGDDEFGELGVRFNMMSEKLALTMATLKQMNDELNDEIEKVRKAEEESRQLLDELVNARKMEAVGTLAGGIAHEFNNLLQSVQTSAEFLQLESSGNEKQKKHLTSIIKATDRGAELTKRLLTFSQRLEGEMRPFSLQSAILQLKGSIADAIPSTVEFHLTVIDKPMWITGDRVAFEEILANLVMNARDAVGETGRITLELIECPTACWRGQIKVPEGSPGAAVLRVKDTGPGMDETMRQKIFEPFYTTKPVGIGTGLGLAITYGVVRSHGGRIECESAPGMGTTFTLWLPLVNVPS